jgi:hypothetical protein
MRSFLILLFSEDLRAFEYSFYPKYSIRSSDENQENFCSLTPLDPQPYFPEGLGPTGAGGSILSSGLYVHEALNLYT